MKIKSFALLAFMTAAVISCNSDERDTGEELQAPQIRLSMPDLEDVPMTYSTATTSENRINDCVLLVYRGGSCAAAEQININDIVNNGSASPILPPTATKLQDGDKLYIVCNTGVAAAQCAESAINTTYTTQRTYKGGDPLPFVATIDNYTTTNNIAIATRAVAKIQVKMGTSVPDNIGTFTLANVTWNAANYGATASTILPTTTNTPSTDATTDNFRLVQFEGATEAQTTLYLPEYKSSTGGATNDTDFDADRQCIILKKSANGTDTYYRLDFYNRSTGKFLDTKRNCHYTFTINKVRSEGYRTVAEALANPASNIEYVVYAKSDDYVIESNGQYAIAMTNNECHIFGGGGTYCIANARYTLPNEMTDVAGTTNSITAVGTGLTLLTPTTLTTTQQRIYAKVSETFTSGYLVLKLGNISDTIYVTRTDYDGTTPVSGTLNGKAVSSKVAYKIGNNNIAYTNGTNTYTVNVPAGVRYVEDYIYTVNQNNGNKKIIVGQGITSIISAVMYWGTDTIAPTYRVLDAGINETTLPTSVKVFEIDTICNTETVYLKLPIGGHLASTSAGTVVTTGDDYNVNEIVKLNPISALGGNSLRLVFSPAIRGAADANVYIYNDAACTNMISNIDVEWYARFGYVESSQPLTYMSVLQQPSAGWCTIASNQISVSKYNSFNVLNATNADGPIYARGCNALVKTTDGKKRVFVEQTGLAFISGTYLQAVPISGTDALGHTGSYKYSFTESGTKIIAKQGSIIGLELLSTNTAADDYGRWRPAGESAQAYYRLRTNSHGGESHGYFVKETTHPDYNDAVLYKSGDICSYVTPRYKWRLASNAEISQLIFNTATVKTNDGANGISVYVDNSHTAYFSLLPFYIASQYSYANFSWSNGGTDILRRWFGFTSDGGIRIADPNDYGYALMGNNGTSTKFENGYHWFISADNPNRASTPICVRE